MHKMDENNRTCENRTAVKSKGTYVSRCKSFARDHKLLIVLISLLIIGVVLSITLGVILSSSAEDKVSEVNNRRSISDFRLPQSVIPNHYILEVQPYLIPEDFRFDGKVQIFFTCVEETDKVILHSNHLTLDTDDFRIQCVNDSLDQTIQAINFNASNDFVIIWLFERLRLNNIYVLIINYYGTANSKEEGLFISKHTDDQEIVHYTASTQFQPIHAREVFPCFDEPALKATFDIIVVRWKNMTSLSNMPRIKIEDRGRDWEADIYQRSMKMSTYTVAFVVGKYVGKTEGKVTIWAPKGLNSSSDFAMDVSLKFLNFFEDRLGVPYDPPKLGMVAVMTKKLQAMENWGLIIYQNNLLLLDTNTDSNAIAYTIAHEIAHQWFGNLVTANWWSDIWLNEGVSTYMQQIVLKHFYPERSKIDEWLVYASTEGFMKDCCPTDDPLLDSCDISNIDSHGNFDHPSTVWKNVTDNVSTLDDRIFDKMAYKKGAMIIRMVHQILGNETFWKFMSIYLKENAYKNVDETEFWGYVNMVVSETKNAPSSMHEMTSWTHLPGLPIVSVLRNYDENKAVLSQQSCININRYRSDRWHIPVSYRNQSSKDWNPVITAWLSGDDVILLDAPPKNEWMLINQGVGCFIVSYDSHNWQLLADQLKRNHMVFTADQRYKILADANNLFMLKFPNVTVAILLDLSTYLHYEEEFSILEQQPNDNFLLNAMSLMKLSPMSKEWKEYIIYILGPMYDKAGWRKDAASIPSRLDETFFWLCEYNYTSCVQEAMRRFEIWKNRIENEKSMHPMKISEIEPDDDDLCTAVRENSINEKFVYELYLRQASTPYLSALFCSSNLKLIESLLQEQKRKKNPSFFRSAHRLADNEKHWPLLLHYIDTHFETYSNNQRTFSEMLGLFRLLRNSPRQIEKICQIAKSHLPNLNQRARRQLEKEIEAMEKDNMDLKLIIYSIEKWLKGRPWME